LAENADWRTLLKLGNINWKLEPSQAFQWHLQAYKNSKGDNAALLELAYDYTRQDDCPRALEAWKKLDSAGMFKDYTPVLAGYCHLKLGDDKRAYQMFDRAVLQQQQLEDTLTDLWKRDALTEHAHNLKALKTENNLANLKAVLNGVINFRDSERSAALLAITDVLQIPKNLGETPAQLHCLRPAFEAEVRKDTDAARKAAWQSSFEKCKLLTGTNPLPEDSALARLLVIYAISNKLASDTELLAAHTETLNERAHSQAGDHEALRLLAALQAQTRHPDLKNTDELGWSRYADPEFAASRINGEFQSDNKLSPEGLALLNKAYQQFPHDKRILLWWLTHATPSAEAARQGWRELILLEFHNPTLRRDPLHFWLRATNLYTALNQYRKVQ
jgi:hypothetical protein